MLMMFSDLGGFTVCYFCSLQVVYREAAIYVDLKMNIESNSMKNYIKTKRWFG